MKYKPILFTIPDTVAKPFVLDEQFHSSHQKGTTVWERDHPHNLTVSYHKHFLSKTAMFQIKKITKRKIEFKIL